jgi:Tol biopolymer transport system component
MALAIGTQLGSHEITALLGKGGMGEVYRARDLKLKREVAIKILPEEFARDADRVSRFQREAEVLASLNHPNIAAIHDLEETNGTRYLVLELVEGETLADRTARGPIPVEEALGIAKQICEALETAHERGIIHRDLKPANIKLTPDGKVKVLDFGLAKAMETRPATTALSNSPTMLTAATNAGVILGTAAYMSPEQVVGKPVDRRSDIFSFGSVLFEILTAKPAFTGEFAGDILASVVKDAPDWSSLPAETPEWLRGLLRRCLVKDRKQRLQAIGEARIAFENPPRQQPFAAPSAWRFRSVGWMAAIVMAVVAGLSLWFAPRPRPSEQRLVTHFTIPLPQGAGPGLGGIAFSRDGSRLAFTSGPQRQIFVRDMDHLDAKPVPGAIGAEFLSFSPDGQSISYVSDDRLKKVALAGGRVQDLAEAPKQTGGPPTQTWEADGSILFSQRGALMRVPSSGGIPETLAAPDARQGERFYAAPQLLPGGRFVLATLELSPPRIIALDLKTGKKTVLLEGPEIAVYAPSGGPDFPIGHLVYFDRNARNLMAVPFDADKLRVQGTPAPVGIQWANRASPFVPYSFSPSGVLAYVADTDATPEATMVWVDRKGNEQPLSAPPRVYVGAPQISPDGRNVVLLITRNPSNGVDSDVWVYDLARGAFTRITSEGDNWNPVWSADSKRVIYARMGSPVDALGGPVGVQSKGGLLSATADGTGAPTVLDGRAPVPFSVSRDNKILEGRAVRRGALGGARAVSTRELWVLPLAEGSSNEAHEKSLLTSKFQMRNAQFSQDGRWVAYEGDDSGTFQIYVVPSSALGDRVTVSTGGGTDARWAANSRELFYRNGDKMMVVDVPAGPVFHPGAPRVLFEKAGAYDVAPDGRFFMIKPSVQPATEQPLEMHIIVNWFRELQERVPVK